MIENYALRQHVKPGISGWAQVNGLRGETPTTETCARGWNTISGMPRSRAFALDVEILARTAFEIFRQRNALLMSVDKISLGHRRRREDGLPVAQDFTH